MLVAQPTLSSRRSDKGSPVWLKSPRVFGLLQRAVAWAAGVWRNVASKASVVDDVKVLRYETVACRASVVEGLVLLWG